MSAEVSVCIATYNGMRNISEQLESILREIHETDEVVIVDDCSADGTYEYLMTLNDPRIRLTRNSINLGHVRTFATAMNLAQGRYIMLSDQDDVWIPGRRRALIDLLSTASVAASSFQELRPSNRLTEPTLRFKTDEIRSGGAVLRDLMAGSAPYFGCVMALRADLRSSLLPVPPWVEAHDHWVALAGGFRGGVAVSKHVTTLRRIHGGNLTPQSARSIRSVVFTRLLLLRSALVLRFRSRRRWI